MMNGKNENLNSNSNGSGQISIDSNKSTIQQSLKEIASLLLLLHEHYLKDVSGPVEILAALTSLTVDAGRFDLK